MTIGERIKARRLEIGMSVDQLAEAIGKNRATVYRYESNDIEKYTIDVLYPLASALRTTPAYLMGWDEKGDTSDSSMQCVDMDALENIDDNPITITGRMGQGKSNLINQYIFFKEAKEVAEARQGNANILRMAGRDGSFVERVLTDEQMIAIKAILDALPDASEDL